MSAPLMELRNITKYFGNHRALDDVSVTVRPGEVHCLLGDNGAGKSTLIKVMSGFHTATTGELLLDGQPAMIANPRDARKAGIATVHQDVAMVPLLSVGRNFFLGVEPSIGFGPFRFIDEAKANRIALEQVARFGISRVHDGKQLVGTLSGGERQVLAIARAIYFGARLLILDEPTSALGVKEAGHVLRMIARAKDDGVAIVFITHNARHAMAIGDDFTVLIQGKVAANFARGEKTRDAVLALMAGGEEMTELEQELEAMERRPG